jgi:hypothetical protein
VFVCWRPLSIFVVWFSFFAIGEIPHWDALTVVHGCHGNYPFDLFVDGVLELCPPPCTFVYNGPACSAFSGTQNPHVPGLVEMGSSKEAVYLPPTTDATTAADYSPNFHQRKFIFL